MSFMKPDEVIKMYEKYVIPPYKASLEKKGQSLVFDLENEESPDMQFLKEFSSLLDNKIERNKLLEPEMSQKLLVMFTAAKEYTKDPALNEKLEMDLSKFMSEDPKERLEGVKNMFETLNNCLPENLKLKGDALTKALKFVLTEYNKCQPEGQRIEDPKDLEKEISVLIGEKEKSKENEPSSPAPKPEKEQSLVSESGDFIQKLGFSADPQAKGITTMTELLTQPLSPQLQEDLKQELGDSGLQRNPDFNYKPPIS